MPAPENNSRRLRLILEMLNAQPDGLYKTAGPDGIFPKVFSSIPVEDAEGEIGTGR